MSPREAGLWEVDAAPAGHHLLKPLAPDEVGLAIMNDNEIVDTAYRARLAYEEKHGEWPEGEVRMPDDAPRPRLMMPSVDFAPDHLVVTGSKALVSGRLRYAMALPDTCVQYWPVELIDGSDLADQQEYCWMSYLATDRMFDMERSIFTLREPRPDYKNEQIPHLKRIERFIVRDDFEPRAGLFRMFGLTSAIIATEALIRRVDRPAAPASSSSTWPCASSPTRNSSRESR